MKKRIFALLITFAMAIQLIACGSNHENVSETTNNSPTTPYDNRTLKSIISGIENDFAETIQYLQTTFEETNTTIGDTYEGYIENKQVLADWYTLVLSEEAALFERTQERSIEYFKLISSSIDHGDDDAIDDAMDEYYDKIYDGVMDDFYDDVYDDLMDDAYDTYYDGIVDDGYDTEQYKEWSDTSSDAYKTWFDTSSAVYKCWFDASSTLYKYWFNVDNGFYKGNFDIDAIIEEVNKEISEEETKEDEESGNQEDVPTEVSEKTESVDTSSGGIRPEFQEAMDSYEAFFDEYVDFMNEYASAGTNDMLGMMNDYVDYMEQYAETMEKLEALEYEDMSTEEALLYAEVMDRISAKLLEVEY